MPLPSFSHFLTTNCGPVVKPKFAEVVVFVRELPNAACLMTVIYERYNGLIKRISKYGVKKL